MFYHGKKERKLLCSRPRITPLNQPSIIGNKSDNQSILITGHKSSQLNNRRNMNYCTNSPTELYNHWIYMGGKKMTARES